MIWHIFKKDWKLLWIFVALVALLNCSVEAIYYKLGLFGEYPMLEMLAEELPGLAMFANMFLVAALVHLDAIPGMRQDWLVRPIRRRDLLLEKLLFTIVTIMGPIFVANLVMGLVSHFPLYESLLAAAWRVCYLLVLIILPILILAAVTQNMTQAFIFGCGCSLILTVFIVMAQSANTLANGTVEPVLHSGVGWIPEVFRFAVVLLATGVILRFQYFRRKTFVSRALVVVFGLVLLFSMLFPWGLAFAIEQKLSPERAVAAATSLTFDSSAERYRSPSGVGTEANGRGNQDNAEIFLPLRIEGIHADGILLSDRSELRLFASDGSVVYHGNGEDMEIDRPGSTSTQAPAYQKIELPQSFSYRNHDKPLRAQLDYSLTLFGLDASYSIPALKGDERMSGWGWCQTKMNESGTAVELRCMRPGRGPICGSVFLENTATGTRNPERSACMSDYTPFGDRPIPDNFARFGVNIPFRDPSGLAKYPVDGPQLQQSRIVIRVYEPEAHFTRSLVIPQVRLKDWEPK